MKKLFKMLALAFALVFLLPAAVSFLIWQADDTRPTRWNEANWSTANLLPPADANEDALVHVMAARTGRWKGAFSVHSWIVVKQKGADTYSRYEVVGWGTPLRQDAYAPDARWYSNEPQIIHTAKGERAEKLILDIERAVFSYPYGERGDYRIWPGPNSNTFVAHVLDQIAETGWTLPANAIGRDWPADGSWVRIDPDGFNFQISASGFVGLSLGFRHGFEVNVLGLVAGVDFARPGVKLPGFGTLSL